jgi:two-component system, chemotaxis family, protein-glutamate methylesterase/glutaminase
MSGRNLIVIGASMGGIETLTALLGQLPADLPAAVLIVQHTSADRESRLAGVLSRASTLPVSDAEDSEPILEGRIYLAPPDCHMLVADGHLRIRHGPRENRSRPAIDPLFRTAAVARRNRVIGVVLTGLLDDGASGLRALKRCGGVAVVQSPEDAAYPSMPRRAMEMTMVDHVLPVAQMGALLQKLVQEEPGPAPEIPREILNEVRLTERAMGLGNDKHERGIDETGQLGNLAPFTCPECSGAMWAIKDEERFRCHVGHSFTLLSFLSEQDRSLEQALWAAVRTLEERYKALDALTSQEEQRGQHKMARSYANRADEARGHARQIRDVLLKLSSVHNA